MKKSLVIVIALILGLSTAACSTDKSNTEAATVKNATASETANKTNNPNDILTRGGGKRVVKNGTPVKLTIGNKVIPATLNDSVAAKDLLSRLPYKIPLNKYPDDYCAVMAEPLQYAEADKHRGWKTCDIDFVLPAKWFVLLFNQTGLETTSTWHINLGTIDADPSVFNDLDSSVEVLIERAE